jgi:hypothetical protein
MTLDDLNILSVLDVQDTIDTLVHHQVLLECLDREIAESFRWDNPELKEALTRLATILDAYDHKSVTKTLRKCSDVLERERQRSPRGVNP